MHLTIATTCYFLNDISAEVCLRYLSEAEYIFTCKVFSLSRDFFPFYWTIPHSPWPYDALRVYAFSGDSLYQSIHCVFHTETHCKGVWLMPIPFNLSKPSLLSKESGTKISDPHVENH